MKQSITFKTLIILSIVIAAIFVASAFLFSQNDNKLIADIRSYNLNQAMAALDARLEERLRLNKEQMEDTANMIAKNSSTFLLNFDNEGLQQSLLFDIKKEGVQAIKVWDEVVYENFLTALKMSDEILFENSVPNQFEQFIKLNKPINNINGDSVEKIGYITLYYDESLIINQIQQLKSNTKNTIENFNKEIDSQQQKSNIAKLTIAISSLFTILVVISILLMNFVNKPLKILESGLDDFFLFLQNKREQAKKIQLSSNDEFGSMAKSLNENILVSSKLHEEIRELNTNLEKKVQLRTQELAEINQELQDSIEYASTIQKSFLKNNSIIKQQFSDTFVIWQPRDKVGGDLYIYEESDPGVLFGVIDCTGHSVPGGFMTMLAGSMVKKLASELFSNPAKLLSELNIAIKYQLSQDSGNALSDDGLDMGLCFINKDKNILKYAGAKLDLVYFKDNKLNVIKSNKQSIGYKKSKPDYEYHNHEINIDCSESFYLYSDGITDQAGGKKNFPYGNKKFKNLLSSIQNKDMDKQKAILLDTLSEYQGDNSRRDDITVIGFRV
ncbi:MAG: SpoIIE family protein phosphatase [gamma proteobacterium symbiont of Taylorina sp.]|nr:SpoIIE family protein phosphatase [gamma proteobacterium symbiont of Taylorina sp.]